MRRHLYRHDPHPADERCRRCVDMPLWAQEILQELYELREQIEMTQADIDAETVAIQANTAELALVNDAVAELEAFIVANPTTPVADLDLSGLKAAIADQSTQAAADLATAQADVAALPVVVPPGTNPADVLQTATGVAHPDPIAAAVATNPGSLPVDPITDATAVDAPTAGAGVVVEEPIIEGDPSASVETVSSVGVTASSAPAVDGDPALLANATDPNNENLVPVTVVDGVPVLAGSTDQSTDVDAEGSAAGQPSGE